jgi:hypothetical protein
MRRDRGEGLHVNKLLALAVDARALSAQQIR